MCHTQRGLLSLNRLLFPGEGSGHPFGTQGEGLRAAATHALLPLGPLTKSACAADMEKQVVWTEQAMPQATCRHLILWPDAQTYPRPVPFSPNVLNIFLSPAPPPHTTCWVRPNGTQ